ncbi:glycosyl hydrolase family 17 protein [Nocardia sp. BMG51109]|uniref:glycosyl hydrolase family 17 protein n=1 Tax=Nocardia sp. BMG51109 TaxID=1056816 RepID=UPI0018DC8897|nr:glycosyl hydrolase family 17 protein [Nocardia sp. BMG51109]
MTGLALWSPVAEAAPDAPPPGYVLGVEKPDGRCKKMADYEADLGVLKPVAGMVRIESASNCNAAVTLLPVAKKTGTKVFIGATPEDASETRPGVWDSPPADSGSPFEADMSALAAAIPGNESAVAAIIVGNGALYRGVSTGAELADKVGTVASKFPAVPVGVADAWSKWADGTADPVLARPLDYALIAAFPYWEGKAVSEATPVLLDDVAQATAHIQADGRESVKTVVETGWPSDGGESHGNAKAGTENQERYFRESIMGLINWGTPCLVFEAFDEAREPFVADSTGSPSGTTHWGVFTSDGKAKFDLSAS